MPSPRSRAIGVAAAALLSIALAGCSAATVTRPAPTPSTTVPAPDKPQAGTAPDGVTSGFRLLRDQSGVVSANIPDTWTATSVTPLTTADGTLTLLNLRASPDLDAYANGWDTPGVSISATDDPAATTQQFLDNFTGAITDQCEQSETGDYDDSVYTGTYIYFPHCGKTATDFLALVVQDEAKTHIVVLSIQMVSAEDKSTNRDEILNTFYAIYPS